MPSASGTGPDPDPAADPDSVLAAERAHLTAAREFLRLMREDVLSLRALGGDPVSEEYLKAALYHRAAALTDLPDTPLFFGRLDYDRAQGGEFGGEQFHIGRRHVHDPDGHPVVIDWRAPVSRPFYRASPAEPMGLAHRRRFGFSGGELTAFEDEDFTGRPRPRRRRGRGQPDPAERDRAAPVRPDARHRLHHPARPGRHRPRRRPTRRSACRVRPAPARPRWACTGSPTCCTRTASG